MPRTLGQYELVQRIGQGGMAEVWKGRRQGVGRAQKTVAIKLMSPRVAGDARHRRMFLDEARLSMLMTHSNVVQVFDAGEDQGRLFLAMEWVDGLDLARLCQLRRHESEPWPPHLVAYVIGEILQGLAYAHHLLHEGRAQCVVHRDISPHNVLVSTSGEVKIADFGVARLAEEDTSGMHIKGKLRYMAPEHLAGRSREPTVDLYGAGAVLHELLQGARFRDGVDEVDLYGMILGGRVPPLTAAGVPPELASLREGLLRPDPRQRIPTAARALEYLQAWAGYRNAAGELAQVCRRAMGVTAPRSGVDPGSGEPSVDAMARTLDAGVATRTSRPQPGSGGGGDEVTTRLPTPARSTGRRAALGWMLGIGGMAGLGALGVVLWGRDDEDRAQSVPGAVPPGTGPVASADAAGSVPAGDGGGAEELPGRDATSTRPESTSSGDAPGSTGGSASAEAPTGGPAEEATSSDGPAMETPSPRPRGTVTIELGLRSPLRTAQVRIGRGKPVVVAPTATVTVPAGRPMIYWKPAGQDVWVEGRRVRLVAGRRYSIRLTTTGPVLE